VVQQARRRSAVDGNTPGHVVAVVNEWSDIRAEITGQPVTTAGAGVRPGRGRRWLMQTRLIWEQRQSENSAAGGHSMHAAHLASPGTPRSPAARANSIPEKRFAAHRVPPQGQA